MASGSSRPTGLAASAKAALLFTAFAALLWALFQERGTRQAPPGNARLLRDPASVAPEAGSPQLVGVPSHPVDPGTQPPDTTVASAPRRSIRGTVVASKTGSPIGGAVIAIGSRAQGTLPAQQSVQSGADGTFAITLPLGEDLSWFAVASGFRRSTGDLGAEQSVLMIALETGDSIRGRVVDLTGAGVGEVNVWAHRPSSRSAWPARTGWYSMLAHGDGSTATTLQDGSFVLSGLATGIEYELRASKAGFGAPHGGAGVLAFAGAADVVIEMSRTATIWVRCSDEQGALVPAHRITFEIDDLPAAPGEAWVAESPSDLQSPDANEIAEGMRFVFQETRGVPTKPFTFAVSMSCPGMRVTRAECEAKFGTTTVCDAVLTRSMVAAPGHDVTVRLAIDGATPDFDGILEISVATHDSLYSEFIRFAAGVAEHPVRLPVSGARLALAGGASPESFFCLPSRLEFSPVDSEAVASGVARLPVSMVPVDLVVRDADGREVHGFDLLVTSRRSLRRRPWVERWAGCWHGEHRPVMRAYRIWLAPGDTEIHVSHPGLGGSVEGVELTAGGSLRRTEMRLRPELEVRFRAARAAMQNAPR